MAEVFLMRMAEEFIFDYVLQLVEWYVLWVQVVLEQNLLPSMAWFVV